MSKLCDQQYSDHEHDNSLNRMDRADFRIGVENNGHDPRDIDSEAYERCCDDQEDCLETTSKKQVRI